MQDFAAQEMLIVKLFQAVATLNGFDTWQERLADVRTLKPDSARALIERFLLFHRAFAKLDID